MLEYKQISPKEILDQELGPFNWKINVSQPIRKQIATAMRNRQAINDWIEKISKDGWKLIGCYEYDQIAYGGSFIFCREKEDKENDSVFEPLDIEELIEKFEEETGKNAIWKNDFTKNFLEWKEEYVHPKD